MSFEEEFDKIIRQKSEETEYPFDAQNWESAKEMIASDRKATRSLKLKKIFKPAIAVTAIGSLAFLSFMYFNQNPSQAVLIAEQTKENTVYANKSENKIITTENKPELSSVATQNNTQETNLQASLVNPDITENTSTEVSKSNEKSVKKLSSAVIAKENSGFNSQEANKETPSNDIPARTENNNRKDPSVIGTAIVAKNISGSSETTISETPLTADESPIVSEQKTSASDPIEISENAKSESVLLSDHLKGLNLSLPHALTDLDIVASNFVMMKQYDEEYFKPKSKTHYMNVEAGMSYLTGWNTAAENDGKGMNYFGGINYGFYLSNKISIGIGVQAYNVDNMNSPYYVSSHKEYDFGSTTIYTVVTCSQMNYASIPLHINYAINKSNTIGLGFNASYLLNAYTSSESYYYLDNAKITTATSSEKAVYDGINQYNYMLTAHYSLRFCKRFGLNAEAMYGLTDLIENSSSITNKENTTGLRLSLTYTLFDK